MSHYQITVAESGKCLERLVEDVYNSDGNIVTNVLGNWQPCQRRHVGLGKGTNKNSVGSSKNTPNPIMSVFNLEIERTNILMMSVIFVFLAIILYKLN